MLRSPFRGSINCLYVRNIIISGTLLWDRRLSSSQRRHALDGETNNDAALAHHSFVKLGPAFVLAINLALQIDQGIHSAGKRNNFRRAIDLDPASAVKGTCKDAKSGARITPQVVDLVCSLPAADDNPAASIQPRCYRRHLQPAVFSPGREYAQVVLRQKLFGTVNARRYEFTHNVLY